MFTFTDEQKQVIYDGENNILLLARAGSGKTFTIANKIAEAVKTGLDPKDALCLTFTVKGAQEISDDVNKYCGKEGVNVFTVHSFCYHVIKEFLSLSGAFRIPNIADEVDQGEILNKILIDFAVDEEYSLSDGAPTLPEKQLTKIISIIKHKRNELGFSHSSEDGYDVAINTLFKESQSFNSLFSVRKSGIKITDYSLIDLLKKKGRSFALSYQRVLRASSLLDFDDLIFFAKEIISQSDYKKPAYKLIIVDEMQDTSILEYSVIKRFFENSQVIMCGDPFQTIYSWRGSSPFEIIDDFVTTYKAKQITLNGNRRSSKILTYAGWYYLSQTFGGLPLPPEIAIDEKEDKISVVSCYGEEDEGDFIFNFIKNYQGDKSSLCVMSRSNRYLAGLYRHFERKNLLLEKNERIPFFTADSDFQFYKKPVVKDFLCFLRLLANPSDTPSFSRIAEKYIKGVGKETLSAIKDFGAYGISLSAFLNEDTYSHGDPYFSLMSAYKSKNIVVYDLETTGLDLERDEAIQISAYKFSTGETFNRFIIPTVEISEKAISTHGFDLEYIKSHGGEDAKMVLLDFVNFASGCALVGHNNNAFDDVMLNRQLKENGLTINTLGYFDTLRLCEAVLPNLKNYKLAVCAEHFGIVNERAHDAYYDVLTTAKLLENLCLDFYIPQTDARRRIIEQRKGKFLAFYESYIAMKERLLKGDMLSLIKYIDEKFAVLTLNSKKADRESANDLFRALKQIENSSDIMLALRSFLSDTALSGSQLDIIIKKHGKIPLITVHQSKGCEFETVILAGAGENELPSYGARQSGDEREEKRIFYVALSRAKKTFIITYPSKKVYGQNVYDRYPSPYIKKLPSDAVKNISTY